MSINTQNSKLPIKGPAITSDLKKFRYENYFETSENRPVSRRKKKMATFTHYLNSYMNSTVVPEAKFSVAPFVNPSNHFPKS